ncbi:MAG: hypothetical protein AAGA56_29325, partial [Myxococcota bacterium]
AAIEAGFAADGRVLKFDTVLLGGVNENELLALLDYAAARRAELRFIEYMDVGGATQWAPTSVVSRGDVLRIVGSARGPLRSLPGRGSAPAERFALPSQQVFGIIASTTQPFCGACDRARLTADGHWYHCLYAPSGTDLKAPLRAGLSDAELLSLIRDGWQRRRDRGAEERLAHGQRGPLVPLDALRRDPRLEMHTRGG